MCGPQDVRLRVATLSLDITGSAAVISQRNLVEDLRECHLTWKVIQILGHGYDRLFVSRHESKIGVTDALGNTGRHGPESSGQRRKVRRLSGDSSMQERERTGTQDPRPER